MQVLLLEDTTSYNFSQHPATVGLGPLENESCRGFQAHSTLAVSEAGVPLGVIEQVVWARSEEACRDRHHRAFEDKESYKWVQALPDTATQAALPEAIVVSDRESPIDEFLDELLERGLGFVVRAMQGRGFTLDGQDVFATLGLQPVQARLSLARHPNREARQAEVEVRFTPLTLKRPRRSTARRESLTLNALEVSEPQPPPGETPVHWLLLTSLPVESLDQAQTVIRYYAYRWLIERFHFVLKSGCKLEERQLREVTRLERLLAVFSQVAWQLLWLTYQARLDPHAPCTVSFSPMSGKPCMPFIIAPSVSLLSLLPYTRPPAGLPNWAASWLAKATANPASKSFGAAGPAFKTSLTPGPFFIPLSEMWVMYSQIWRGPAPCLLTNDGGGVRFHRLPPPDPPSTSAPPTNHPALAEAAAA